MPAPMSLTVPLASGGEIIVARDTMAHPLVMIVKDHLDVQVTVRLVDADMIALQDAIEAAK